jgi:hypothetical protein
MDSVKLLLYITIQKFRQKVALFFANQKIHNVPLKNEKKLFPSVDSTFMLFLMQQKNISNNNDFYVFMSF